MKVIFYGEMARLAGVKSAVIHPSNIEELFDTLKQFGLEDPRRRAIILLNGEHISRANNPVMTAADIVDVLPPIIGG